MKILLLEHPRSVAPERCNDIANTPLSSCLQSGYAAGMLKAKGHEVEIVEGYLDGLSYKDIADRVSAMKPDILGVHLVYHWQNDHALFDFLDTMKKEGLASSVTAYGFYATVSCKNILNDRRAVDSVIVGEPERPLRTWQKQPPSKTILQRPRDRNTRRFRRRQASGTGICGRSRQPPFSRSDRGDAPASGSEPARQPRVLRKMYVLLYQFFFGTGNPWRGRSPENIAREIDADHRGERAEGFLLYGPQLLRPRPDGAGQGTADCRSPETQKYPVRHRRTGQ